MNERLIALLLDSFPKILLPGLTMTIPLTVISFSIAMVIATAVALIQFAHVKVLSQIARFYIWACVARRRWCSCSSCLRPAGRGHSARPVPGGGARVRRQRGRILRGDNARALESVPVGQIEAGYCVGMRYMQIMRRIVLPQALRTAFPPLSNSLIAMVKDTSLAWNITSDGNVYGDAAHCGAHYEMLPLYCEVAVIYLMFSTVLTFVQRWGEKKLAVYGGRRRAK
ncbi:MAG: ABC transporter permease subunit [Christensenellales bacterium]